MVDVVFSLRTKGHNGHVTAVSRHGLVPRPHADFADGDGFLRDLPLPETAVELLRTVRTRIKDLGPEAGWQSVMDAVSEMLPQIWRSFTPAEKARSMRRLLPFWDAHRFRIPPESYKGLHRQMANGSLAIARAAVSKLARGEKCLTATLRHKGGGVEKRHFDAVVVCTGPDKNPRKNKLVAALLERGVTRLDDSGFGMAVDEHSRVIAADGLPQDTMFAFGPMTRSSFGEMSGANDIAMQIEKVSSRFFPLFPTGTSE
jgi:uncharacterized NAD(P)/FAD-binding protein YdhS